MDVGTHIVKSYDDQLVELSSGLIQMGVLAKQQLTDVIKAIHARDNESARRIYEQDDTIDKLENDMNDLGLKVLALRQPMAGDLRLIVGSIRMTRDLERIGDYAANLAKRAKVLNKSDTLNLTRTLLQMADLLLPMLDDAMAAFQHKDTNLADKALAQDDAIDALYKQLIKDLIAYMTKYSESVEVCSTLLFMAKDLERIGDRATNIAENVYFIIEGAFPYAQRRDRQG